MSKSVGESRVRVEFNIAKSETVDQLKQKTAELINLTSTLGGIDTPGEKARLISLAMTTYEEAAMWAVKAATY